MMMNNYNQTGDTARVMEKPVSQEQQQPLKCPRCDSSNTKFCYYNNYSLSQPRHFCKACKRYWTRGGTLRNVPVGGGCRKNNKRIRRSSSSSSSPAAAIDISSSSTSPAASSAPLQISPPQTKTQINPLFYGLPINPSELNLPFPRLFGSRVSSSESCLSAGYDNNHDSNNSMISSTGFLGGFVNSSSSNPLLSSYPVFRSSSITTSPSTSTTTLASLIASSLEQRKFNASASITNHGGCNSSFLGMPPYYNGESLMAAGNVILENGELLKGVKMEGDAVPMNHQNVQTEGVVNINNYSTSSSDPSFPWNGAWMDPSSMGSSLPAFSHLAS